MMVRAAVPPDYRVPLMRMNPAQPLLPLNLAVTVTFAEKTAPKPPLGTFYAAVLSTLLAMRARALDTPAGRSYVPNGLWHSA